jgi:sugar fermentation stimulation protein A
LARGILIRRYKRFLADIENGDGEILTVYCPNTGSMKNCIKAGAPAWYSYTADAKRKYPYTWQIATTTQGHLAGINTGLANALVREALEAGLIRQVGEYKSLRAEVAYGIESSRIDFLVQGERNLYIEVKNVTLCEGSSEGFFPDAVSERGTKHLRELTQCVRDGDRAMLVYCVQHSGIESVAPARHIDPRYADAFDEAVAQGVEVVALGASLSDEEIVLDKYLSVHF